MQVAVVEIRVTLEIPSGVVDRITPLKLQTPGRRAFCRRLWYQISVPLVPPLPDPLVEDIIQNRCLPVIGSGMSRNAVLPHGIQVPLWRDLGDSLGRRVTGFPSDETNPLEAISAYEHEFGRIRLVDELRNLLFHASARPGAMHEAFCRLPFDIVCTTNFDSLLEKGYDLVSRACRVIVEEEQLSAGVDPRTVTLIKLHGDLDHPHRLVMVERDYDHFVDQNPLMITYLTNLLITRTALFIGYSLDDPDFRAILAAVHDRLGRLSRQTYVLTVGATAYGRTKYERRGVRCIQIA